MNGPLSDTLAEILSVLGDSVDKSIGILYLSTEEMCHYLETLNQNVEEGSSDIVKKPVILPMDVSAMFPSLDVETVAREVGEEFVTSDLEIKVDERERGLYLGIFFQKERRRDLRERQLDEVIPVRKHEAAKTVHGVAQH